MRKAGWEGSAAKNASEEFLQPAVGFLRHLGSRFLVAIRRDLRQRIHHDGAQRHLDAETQGDLRDELHRQNAVAADLEEVSVTVDGFGSQYPPPDSGDGASQPAGCSQLAAWPLGAEADRW